jgi:hypothetical protein
VQALSHSQYWKDTVIFVVEDDAQAGPDHTDSHRAPFYAISAYNRSGAAHRFINTTDVLARSRTSSAWGGSLSSITSADP